MLLASPEQGNKDIASVQRFLDQFRQKLELSPSSNNVSDIKLQPSNLQEQLQIIFQEQVSLLSIGMGDPSKIVEPAHASGAKVMSMIQLWKKQFV